MSRILIVANDPLVRAGLSQLLETRENLDVAGQTGLDELLEAVDVYLPDLILWDMGWDSDGGLLPAAEIDLPVIVLLPDHLDQLPQLPGLVAGLRRGATPAQIEIAVLAAEEGLTVFDPLFRPAPAETSSGLADAMIFEPLTPRESEVLTLLADGLTNKGIAQILEVSPHTVKFHVTSILEKLGAQSRTEAVTIATRAGLLVI